MYLLSTVTSVSITKQEEEKLDLALDKARFIQTED
jgi:hypothetical protein